MAKHFSEFDEFNIVPELKPLGAWTYFGLSILFSIPIVGLICLIVFSFSDANINRRNYARSYFCMLLLVLVLVAVLFFTGLLGSTIEAIQAGRWPDFLSWLPWAKA
ncbi:MAG: hypothetical protein Q4A01_10620 [Coriobacteriales bacterium]|nr:hypothetical protein [Coriobacteriales bacterium]